MTRRIMYVILVSAMFLILTACERGLEIVNVELGSFPYNIVYYVGETDSVDLAGATIIITTRGTGASERCVSEDNWLVITDNVDFLTPGVYEVVIMRSWGGPEQLVGRIPIQVIERGVESPLPTPIPTQPDEQEATLPQ